MAKQESLNIDAGATYPLGFECLNDDDTVFPLTGYTAQLQIRTTASASTAIVTVTGTIDTVSGIITTDIPAVKTALLTGTQYVYAVEITAPGGEPVYRISEGNVYVSAEVVR